MNIIEKVEDARETINPDHDLTVQQAKELIANTDGGAIQLVNNAYLLGYTSALEYLYQEFKDIRRVFDTEDK